MPECHPTFCLFPSLPLDNSPHFCFDCKARFHGLCQNVVHHPKADELKLSFCFEYLCPGCANAKPSSEANHLTNSREVHGDEFDNTTDTEAIDDEVLQT
jgi:hypothetical protein